MPKIAASILTADFANLASDLQEATDAGIDLVHFDVMDGNFVPNITFGADLIKSLKSKITLPFDVHLMINQPARYFDSFIKAGADFLSFHWEAFKNKKELLKLIDDIKNNSVKVGLAISPETQVLEIKPVLKDLDLVVVMTVKPGFGGQRLILDCLEKVSQLKRLAQQQKFNYLIEVDGGVTSANINQIIQKGANILVVGSAVFNKNNSIENSVAQLKKSY